MNLTTPKPKPPPLHQFGAAMRTFLDDPMPEHFVPSGLKGLDRLMLGAMPGEMIVLGGDAGEGKTTLAVQWLLTAAQNGTPAAMLSLEMHRRAVEQRLISGLTGVPLQTIRMKAWTGDQAKVIGEAADFLNSLPLYADDRGGLTADGVYDTLTYWKGQGIGLAVVDYLQHIRGGQENRASDVGYSVGRVKAAAKEADMPVILLSSLNRAAASRENRTPRKQDLRESGDIEFEADAILMFHYPNPDDQKLAIREGEIHVLKNRMGATGIAPVWFYQAEARFEDRISKPPVKPAKKKGG